MVVFLIWEFRGALLPMSSRSTWAKTRFFFYPFMKKWNILQRAIYIYTIVSMKEINCMDNYVWWRLFLSSNILHKKTMHSFSVLLHTSRNLLYTFAGKESCRTSIEIPEYSQMFLSYETLFVVVKSGYFCAWQELWEGLFCDSRRRNAMIWATHQGLFLWTIPITPQEAFNYRETHLKPRE